MEGNLGETPPERAFATAVSLISVERGEPARLAPEPDGPLQAMSAAWLIGGKLHGLRITAWQIEAYGWTGIARHVTLTPNGRLLADHVLMAATAVGLLDPSRGMVGDGS